jgi:putative transcriptional regulator
MTSEPGKGRLLVATPLLGDPNFERTVVLLLEAGEDGAVGIVLNRPTDTVLTEALPEWAVHAAHPPVVFVGGPVQQDSAIGLARSDGLDGTGDGDGEGPVSLVLADVGILNLSWEAEDAAPAVDVVRIFAGYAGWAPGQLEVEIEAGAWFVVDGQPDDALSPDPEALWRSVLRRQRDELALFAAFPDDPSMN